MPLPPEQMQALAAQFGVDIPDDDEPEPDIIDVVDHGITLDRPIKLNLPGFDGDPAHMGTDGAYNQVCGVGAYAAVTGDGRAIIGAFTGGKSNSQLAELQAVRHGLRLHSGGRIRIFCDNKHVVDTVNRIIGGQRKRLDAFQGDREAVWEIKSAMGRLTFDLRFTPDLNDPKHKLIPTHRLMSAAHRLCWALCRLTSDGVPVDAQARAWMTYLSGLTGRHPGNLTASYKSFRAASTLQTQ